MFNNHTCFVLFKMIQIYYTLYWLGSSFWLFTFFSYKEWFIALSTSIADQTESFTAAAASTISQCSRLFRFWFGWQHSPSLNGNIVAETYSVMHPWKRDWSMPSSRRFSLESEAFIYKMSPFYNIPTLLHEPLLRWPHFDTFLLVN